MLKNGAAGREVLKRLLPEGELAKFNPYHLSSGPGSGQFNRQRQMGRVPGRFQCSPRDRHMPVNAYCRSITLMP
jgi:hypothetical protein